MTFEEGLIKKEEIGETSLDHNHLMRVFVVPQKSNDFYNYLEYYRNHKKSDKMAKMFCSDNNFEVYGLYVELSGVIFKKLS